MESETFDTYLVVEVAGSEQTFTNDDFNGSQRRSFVAQTNPTAGTMDARIVASAYGSAARGAYSVRYLVTKPPKDAQGPQRSRSPRRSAAPLRPTTPEVPLTSNDDLRAAPTPTRSRSPQVRRPRCGWRARRSTRTSRCSCNGALSQTRNDDFGGSRSVSQVSLSQPGTYTVLRGHLHRAEGTGAYTLADPTSTAPAAPRLRPLAGQARWRSQGDRPGRRDHRQRTAEVALTANDDPRKADGYEVELRAGQTLVVEMESGSFDTYLKLVRGGTFIARNDDDWQHAALRSSATPRPPAAHTPSTRARSPRAVAGPTPSSGASSSRWRPVGRLWRSATRAAVLARSDAGPSHRRRWQRRRARCS